MSRNKLFSSTETNNPDSSQILFAFIRLRRIRYFGVLDHRLDKTFEDWPEALEAADVHLPALADVLIKPAD